MTAHVRLRLCLMMFLQFFVWGGWFVTLGTYLAHTLHASGAQIGLAYATQSWGAILAPLLAGLLADRYFNAERMLAVLHFAGAALLWMLHQASNFEAFYPWVLGYMIVYMPTLALANAVAFRHVDSPARQFSGIRVWGTAGWVASGLLISLVFAWDSAIAVAAGGLRNTFLMCALASALLGGLCLFLPATPPAPRGSQANRMSSLLGALRMLRERNFLVFLFSSILICIPLAFYYQHANQFLVEIGVEHATVKQSLGQVSEVVLMLLIPLFLARFGIKATLLIGMCAWTVRYVLFALGGPSEGATLLLLGIALHGVCYDFFFVSGQIYTDSKAAPGDRSAAQGLVALATYGIGMLVGFWAAGRITDQYSLPGGLHDWWAIWLYPACFAAVVAAGFLVAFRNERVSLEARQ